MAGENNRKSFPKRGLKKMDAVITGIILGGIVASIYGIKKNEEHRSQESSEHPENDKHSLGAILRMLAFGIPAAKPPKPATLYEKFLSFFR
jgi:hypothetical protein